MARRGVRVIKLGGSLLDWLELPAELQRWLTAQPPSVDVIVVGGGAIVERLRALDRVHRLPDEAAHWLAVRAMSLTAAIAAQLLGQATLVRSLDALRLTSSGGPQILDVEPLLRSEHGSADALACSWDVTSDSIAARVATKLQADELVLLKSALPEGPATHESAATGGYVDAQFAEQARSLRVRLVNLRDRRFAEVALTADHAAA